jgi:hypothetical protein
MKLMKLSSRVEYNHYYLGVRLKTAHKSTNYIYFLLYTASIQGRLMTCKLIFQSRKNPAELCLEYITY